MNLTVKTPLTLWSIYFITITKGKQEVEKQ